jgi:uncharacterized membrane protein YdbT with pleckstrin-like domain
MTYAERHLIEGERVVYTTRLHWVVLIRPVLLGLLCGLPGVALLVYSGAGSTTSSSAAHQAMMAGGLVLIVIGLLFVIHGIVKRNATRMTVTNMRVIAKIGIAARRTIELLLSRVESIGVEESVMGRMLGYGTVIVRGMGGTPESFDKVAHPLELRSYVQQQIAQLPSK